MKKYIALVLCVVLLMMSFCGCKKEPEYLKTPVPTPEEAQALQPVGLELTDVSAKAGEQVEMKLTLPKASYLWGFSWAVNYDSTVMKPVDIVMNESYTTNFEMTLNKTGNPLVLQGEGRGIQNYTIVGDVATLTFLVADNAAPGKYEVSVTCEDKGNNIDANAYEVPFIPTTAVLTVVE